MDIEHLTKHQIILLTLLVSFVTSIATGIVTVSLMDVAPVSVTRTINQIVERTVENVVPAVTSAPVSRAQGAATVTKETTVVVKDEDLTAASIAKAQRAVVRIISKNDRTMLVARGVVVDIKGTVLSDRGALEPMGTLNFEAILPSGDTVPAVMRLPTGSSTLAVLDLDVSSSSGEYSAIPLADFSKLRLGASVIRIGGTGADTVGTGVIARLPDAHGSLIEASVVSTTPGSIIITSFGDLVGLVTSASAAVGSDFYTLAISP